MKGFTGEYYNGIPIFIRAEYERSHQTMSEKERLEDLLNISFSSFFQAITYAENHYPNLLYHKKGWAYDNWLTNGMNDANLWVEYKSGYVHKITGEYVKGMLRPTYDSMPCWTIPSNIIEYAKEDKALENATAFALWLISIINKEKGES